MLVPLNPMQRLVVSMLRDGKGPDEISYVLHVSADRIIECCKKRLGVATEEDLVSVVDVENDK